MKIIRIEAKIIIVDHNGKIIKIEAKIMIVDPGLVM